MKRKKYLPYVVFILIALIVEGVSGIVTAKGMPAYQLLTKPALTPPSIAFPIVWSILYVLMGIGAARVWTANTGNRNGAIAVFAFQLALNFFWSVWFFGVQKYLLAFVWLVALIVSVAVMLRVFYRIDRLAGLLQIPYLLWLFYAAYLNFAIWLLNR